MTKSVHLPLIVYVIICVVVVDVVDVSFGVVVDVIGSKVVNVIVCVVDVIGSPVTNVGSGVVVDVAWFKSYIYRHCILIRLNVNVSQRTERERHQKTQQPPASSRTMCHKLDVTVVGVNPTRSKPFCHALTYRCDSTPVSVIQAPPQPVIDWMVVSCDRMLLFADWNAGLFSHRSSSFSLLFRVLEFNVVA